MLRIFFLEGGLEKKVLIQSNESDQSECATKLKVQKHPGRKKWKRSYCAALMLSTGSLLFQVWLLFSNSQPGSWGLAAGPLLLSKRLKSKCSIWAESVVAYSICKGSISLIPGLTFGYTFKELHNLWALMGEGVNKVETHFSHKSPGSQMKVKLVFILQDLPQGLLKVCIVTEAKAESHICRTPIKEWWMPTCVVSVKDYLFSYCSSLRNPILH